MPRTPSARGNVNAFLAMDVMSRAIAREKRGEPVVYMCVGEPGTAAPRVVRAAAEAALRAGRLGYTEALGLASLRAAIARHYGDHYGLEIAPERVAVTTGSSAGFDLAFLAAFDPGDRVAIASPGYPPYRNILTALGLVPVEIEVDASTRWALTAQAIERAHAEAPLKGVLVASPANPTGTTILPDALRDIVRACRDIGAWLISDEIYHRLVWTGTDVSALSFDNDVIVLNSFSKYYSMTGWRIGWMILPEPLVRPVERLAQNLFISTPELAQRAAIEAFSAEATAELDQVKAVYAENRARLMAALPAIGFTDVLPMDGAFYAYADASRFTNDSLAFAHRMLDEAGVAATPGVDFDGTRGHRYMRFSFAGTTSDIDRAVAALRSWLE